MNDNDYYLFTVSLDDTGKRIDTYICENISDISRNAVQRLITDNNILVNKKPVNKNYRITGKDIIEVNIPPIQESQVIAENIPLDIKYEDEDLLVVNKPKGMVVHPAVGNESSTLVNALLYHCKGTLSGIGGVARPGIVHRIDKDTSGLLVVAKNDFTHLALAELVKAHNFTRVYTAVIYGKLRESAGTINAPIGRHPTERKKMAVTEKNSREAITHYSLIKQFKDFSYIQLKLETGRTHQIRVHMAYIGHPLAGDPLYGPKKVISSLNGQCLHAKTLGFTHPRTGDYMEFSCEEPDVFKLFLNKLKLI